MSDRIAHLNQALEGRYRVEREVGAGGMATVYLARDLKHDRDVAVKVFHAEVASSVGHERFLREIQISARLNHPHILTLIDSGEVGGVLYYVLPYVEGESLRERIERDGRLTLQETTRFVSHISAALDYAHAQGVVHRDIKPANILLHQGEAMVSDFGIAVGFAAAKDERLTATGHSLGTPSYMSPEQVEGAELDERSDIYGVGCLAYEMLSGRPPFTGPTSQSVLAKILTADPDPLEEAPPAVAEAVLRALARAPEDRFGTAGELADAIRSGAAGAASPTAPASGWKWATLGAVALLAGLIGWQLLAPGRSDASVASAVADIDRMAVERDAIGAWRLLLEIEDALADTLAARLWPEVAYYDTVVSHPAGATVSWRPFSAPDEPWQLLGVTPIEGWLPRAVIALRLELDGFETRLTGQSGSNSSEWTLHPAEAEPRSVVHVPGGTVNLGSFTEELWLAEARTVGDYLIDRYEVTNAQYQDFVDDGGYARPELWEHDFMDEGAALSWEEGVARLVDRTGRPGPSTWEVGRYPDGRDDHPVTGVSWYEAMAYARWAGRQLPTLYHWYLAAQTQRAAYVVPTANFGGEGTTRVGASGSFSGFGVFDVAGNAREWVANATGELRYTAGGGWNDFPYAFTGGHPQPPSDRSLTNGFRLMTDLGNPELFGAASHPVDQIRRDFLAEPPVSEEVFDVFRGLYAYDDAPLNDTLMASDTTDAMIRQRITFDAAYGGERMVLYLFLPRDREPPHQTVVYYPGANALFQTDNKSHTERSDYLAFILRSGRAFAFPVYKSTYERQDDYTYRRQDPSNVHRDHVIQWRQDLGRSIDYLETRPDIDSDALAYFGSSWGGRMGAIMLAVEDRFKAAVLNIAGLSPLPTQPVVDGVHFAPRVTVPVLMLNGRYDHIFPLETHSKPLFQLLGSEIKKHYISEGGHFVPHVELIRESLAWLDEHVGPVN